MASSFENAGGPDPGLGFDLPKLTRSTLNDEVYDTLKDALIQGKIAPGAVMTIRSLADSFGTSMMPVREALRRLVAEHILVLLPNRSVTLPVLTKEKFQEITLIRFSLEGLASEEGARRISPTEIAYMEEMTALMERKENWGAPESLTYNREFHFTLYKASKMPRLVAMIEGLWLQIGPLLNVPVTEIRGRQPTVWERHHAALSALKANRPAKVKQAIIGDIDDAARTIASRLASEII
ncbi:GntR family transcriptional regulator [Aestuariivirga sp.]|uniref:GntR family transcriptional regulator n=1 Tax=Aestuariivirga sp. TaxID=2650926 RepID=UPI0039192890